MVAITVNALYTAWRKRGTTRQLATAIICCVVSALLLLPAIFWLNARFSTLQANISMVEIACMLVYVSLWGLIVPCGATSVYCLFTQPRESNTSFRIPLPRSKRTTVGNASAASSTPADLPHRQPGRPAPFVYSADQPWGWFSYRNGRFQGVRLDLKRTVVTIGREDDNEILLDDDTSSRYHAELAWMNDQPYITDCNSLNGILLNGRRMRGTLTLAHGDFVEIGSHRFLFELAPHPESLNDQDDPLLPYVRRPLSFTPAPDLSDMHTSEPLPATRRPAGSPAFPTRPLADPVTPPPLFAAHQPSPQPAWPGSEAFQLPSPSGACIIRAGAPTGTSFSLDRPQLIVGRMAGCDVHIEDASLTNEYAQFSRSPEGDSVYGVGVLVNDMPLSAPRLLRAGDLIRFGAVCLEYVFITEMKTTPLPPIMPHYPLPSRPQSSPMHLRLPSKPK